MRSDSPEGTRPSRWEVTEMNARMSTVLRDVRAAVPTWKVDLAAPRAVDAPFAGTHTTRHLGPGDDHADSREYRPGDDIRRVDWSATARSGTVQVRQTHAERGMRLTLVPDCTASMRFGTATLTKADLAAAVAAAYSLAATRLGDSVAAVLPSEDQLRWVPPGTSTAHVNLVLAMLAGSLRSTTTTSYEEALRRASALAPSSGTFVLMSDFHDTATLPLIRRLCASHRVVAVLVSDPRESSLEPAGSVQVRDLETGEVYTLDTDSPQMRERFTQTAHRLRNERSDRLRRAGAEVHTLECGPQWLEGVRTILTGARW